MKQFIIDKFKLIDKGVIKNVYQLSKMLRISKSHLYELYKRYKKGLPLQFCSNDS